MMRWSVELFGSNSSGDLVALLEELRRDADKLIHEDDRVEVLPVRPVPVRSVARQVLEALRRARAVRDEVIGVEATRDRVLRRQAELLVDALACDERRAEEDEEAHDEANAASSRASLRWCRASGRC